MKQIRIFLCMFFISSIIAQSLKAGDFAIDRSYCAQYRLRNFIIDQQPVAANALFFIPIDDEENLPRRKEKALALAAQAWNFSKELLEKWGARSAPLDVYIEQKNDLQGTISYKSSIIVLTHKIQQHIDEIFKKKIANLNPHQLIITINYLSNDENNPEFSLTDLNIIAQRGALDVLIPVNWIKNTAKEPI